MSLVSHPTSITLLQLYLLATVAKDFITSVYLHWTAGRYGQCFDDYHLCIDRNGELYLCCKSLAEHKSHTWQRNSAAIGISLCAGFEALAGNEPQDGSPPSIDFGPYEPTALQLEKMALVVAVISKAAGIDISEEKVMTHAEAAIRDGYGPGSMDPELRWDLWYVRDYPGNGLVQGGRLLRGKALWYRSWLEKFNLF